ncbi:MAG: murein hydrolase activator EnvC family protein, partial [bacterium]
FLWQWQYRYLLAISRRDRELVSQLKRAVENTRKLAEDKKHLRERAEYEERVYSQKLFELQQLDKERREESQRLNEQEARYQSLLEKVESDRELLFALLESQRQALKEVEVEVMRLMIREKNGEEEPVSSGVIFSQLKGNLPKPVSVGKIVRGFGQQKHPRLGTVTLNPGVDFQVPPNEAVRVVAPGRVRKISWIRGFGNTIIVEHNEGFFTVYGRVERPVVREKEKLKGNDLLGFTSSGLESASFHFGIWYQKESLDPEEWFSKD